MNGECSDNNDRAVNHGSVGHNYLTDHNNYECTVNAATIMIGQLITESPGIMLTDHKTKNER